MYNELIKLYNNIDSNKYSIGNALFIQSKFFVNTELLLDPKAQKEIRKYNYCKLSNTPPYSTIKDTPYEYINNYFIIDEEIEYIKNADK